MNRQKISFFSIALILVMTLTACSAAPAATQAATQAPTAVTQAPADEPTPQSSTSLPALGTLDAYESALEAVYTKVNPSVVNIQVTQKTQPSPSISYQDPFADLPGFDFFFGNPEQQQQPQSAQPKRALGSGFVWDTDGYIVTNNHVIENAASIQVTFHDGSVANASVVGTDPSSDLAVIKLEDYSGELVPITSSDSSEVKVGQLAIAIGNPYGLENTMTVGIVSALGRSLPTDELASTTSSATFTIPDIIQTDAPINPGNSGGVLVNTDGQLIGVTAAIESTSGANAGIGFAIPSNIVNKVVPELIKNGKYEHAYLGLSGTTLTPQLAEAMDLESTQRGILVIEVTKDTPADEAGLIGSSKKATIDGFETVIGGDVITAIDGQALNEIDDLISYLSANTSVGQKITLTLLRNGEEMTTEATLIARPSADEKTRPVANPGSPEITAGAWMGISVIKLSAEIADAMDLPQDQSGVLIQDIQAGSPADQAGLIGSYKPVIINAKRVMVGGDIITAIDDQPINLPVDLPQYLATKESGDTVTLTILRNGLEQNLSVTLAEKPAN